MNARVAAYRTTLKDRPLLRFVIRASAFVTLLVLTVPFTIFFGRTVWLRPEVSHWIGIAAVILSVVPVIGLYPVWRIIQRRDPGDTGRVLPTPVFALLVMGIMFVLVIIFGHWSLPGLVARFAEPRITWTGTIDRVEVDRMAAYRECRLDIWFVFDGRPQHDCIQPGGHWNDPLLDIRAGDEVTLTSKETWMGFVLYDTATAPRGR